MQSSSWDPRLSILNSNHQPHMCAGCNEPIDDKIILDVLERYWHISCLKCSCCGGRLAELGSSLYVKLEMLFCRQDYIKLFGSGGTCTGCKMHIAPDEMVMRIHDCVYHVKCFKCTHCNAPLHPGDRCSFMNGDLFCEHEFSRLYPATNPSSHSSWIESNNSLINYSDDSANSTRTRESSMKTFLNNSNGNISGFNHCVEKSSFSSYSSPKTKHNSSSMPSKSRGRQKKVESRRLPLPVC